VAAGHVIEDQQVVITKVFRRLRVVPQNDGVIADLGLREYDAQLHPAFLRARLVRRAQAAPGHGSAVCLPPAIAYGEEAMLTFRCAK
jgi:hypothetical protein